MNSDYDFHYDIFSLFDCEPNKEFDSSNERIIKLEAQYGSLLEEFKELKKQKHEDDVEYAHNMIKANKRNNDLTVENKFLLFYLDRKDEKINELEDRIIKLEMDLAAKEKNK